MKALAFRILLAVTASLALLSASSCQTFDPAPDATLAGDSNGAMITALDVPLVLELSEPVVRSTLRIKIVSLAVPGAVDGEGNLLDEQNPPRKQAFKDSTLIAYDGARTGDVNATYGARFQLDKNATRLTITPDKLFAISVPYLLIVEPGLSDLAGHATVPRIRIPFTFRLSGGGPTRLPSGYYYFLMNVNYLSQQLRLYTDLNVNPDTGLWRGIFTSATRQQAGNSRPGCPASCPGDTPMCQLLNPALSSCVKPSEKQTDLDQFLDFLPMPDLPTGYHFVADGFAKDRADGTIAFGTAPFDVDIRIGSGGLKVSAKDMVINGQFTKSPGAKGRFVAKGSFSVALLQLNGIGNDSTEGDFSAMTLTSDEVKTVESFGRPIPTVPPR